MLTPIAASDRELINWCKENTVTVTKQKAIQIKEWSCKIRALQMSAGEHRLANMANDGGTGCGRGHQDAEPGICDNAPTV